jgi:hypothetical protein
VGVLSLPEDEGAGVAPLLGVRAASPPDLREPPGLAATRTVVRLNGWPLTPRVTHIRWKTMREIDE